METSNKPLIMLLDGDNTHTLQVAAELYQDLKVNIIGVGSRCNSMLLRSRHILIKELAPPSSSGEYAATLLDLAEKHQPDMILPVGFRSVAAVSSLRSSFPKHVRYCLPSEDVLSMAFDKSKVLELAAQLGIKTPKDYTDLFNEQIILRESENILEEVPYPVFLKAAHEKGKNLIYRVDTPGTFWPSYKKLREASDNDLVLVQEYVDGNEHTYGSGLLYLNGKLLLQFSHDEIRSIPRLGGSGTRLRIFPEPVLEQQSRNLLEAMGWEGQALVEFKLNQAGEYVLMEINPKFWASYPLASKSGYRFATWMVCRTLELPDPPPQKVRKSGVMVFPYRELLFSYQNGESMLKSLGAMLWPPARLDLNLDDPLPWLPERFYNKFALNRGKPFKG